MRRRFILLLATTAALLAASAAPSSANRLSVNERLMRIVWDYFHSEQENLTFETGGLYVECPVTLEGALHSSTLSKGAWQLIGTITRAALDERSVSCSYGSAEGITLLAASLPWHVAYISFAGTLPAIRSFTVAIIGLSVQIRAYGVNCLFRSTEVSPAYGIFDIDNVGPIRDLFASYASNIPRFSGSTLLCPTLLHYIGAGAVHRLGSSINSITVRLI